MYIFTVTEHNTRRFFPQTHATSSCCGEGFDVPNLGHIEILTAHDGAFRFHESFERCPRHAKKKTLTPTWLHVRVTEC